jgi:hypothetical protein
MLNRSSTELHSIFYQDAVSLLLTSLPVTAFIFMDIHLLPMSPIITYMISTVLSWSFAASGNPSDVIG